MRFRVLPYRQGSASAKALATALGGRVLKLEGSSFKPKETDVLINWGSVTRPPSHDEYQYWNPPGLLKAATNKKTFFEKMKEAHPDVIPQFWTDKASIPGDAYPVVCRTVLAGHSGAGIVLANTPEELVDAPLYVQYVKKKDEYRIHVGKLPDSETIIAVQKKARRLETPDDAVNWKIRNLAGGFIYKREGVVAPDSVLEAACHSLRSSGLDFGAVDVIFNEQKSKAYVLEINTAPGLEGQTVQDYANFFKELQT